ncbi:hypothetical protein J6590_020110 [Homalodisca vitripennis]|nr:hypothetical protein J6590_020110 [Homalodisca vitripennis]
MFTNDFPSCIIPFGECFMYADNTVILSSDRFVESLEIDYFVAVNVAVDCCNNSDLVFDEEKTVQLVFGHKNKEIAVLPNLRSMDHIKHLGVTIDVNHSRQNHVDILCSRLSSVLFALRRTLAVSSMDAASSKESDSTHGWLGNARQLQDNFPGFGILTVVSSYILAAVMSACSRGPRKHAEVHRHKTRFAMDFHLPSHRSAIFEKRPAYSGAKFFNFIPKELKSLDYPKMKSPLRKWLSQRPFYSVNELIS